MGSLTRSGAHRAATAGEIDGDVAIKAQRTQAATREARSRVRAIRNPAVAKCLAPADWLIPQIQREQVLGYADV